MQDLERRYREIADLWCAQDWAAWSATTAPDYVFDAGVGGPRDLATTLEWSRATFRAFPDYAQTVEHVIVSGDTVAGVSIARGTFTGPLSFAGAELPPTGGSFALPYVKVLRFDDSGLVVEDRQVMDYEAMIAAVHR